MAFEPLPPQVKPVCDSCGHACELGDAGTAYFDADDPLSQMHARGHNWRFLGGRLWCEMCLEKRGIDPDELPSGGTDDD